MTSTDADAPNHLAYSPSLDGLRALAVAAVVVFHLRETGLTGGFLGVDTFFVLSGFLITTLLVLEWRRTQAIGLIAFWGRRARRLLPALIAVLVAVGIFAHFEVPTTELGRLRWDGIAGLFYVANWRFVASKQSYFDLFGAASPFRHLWSLAIEEQFYLVWPLVSMACLGLGRGRLRLLATVAAAGTVVSVALMAGLFNADDPSRAYYGTDTHAHPILIGVLLAIVLVDRPSVGRRAQHALNVGGVVALAAIVAAFAFAHADSATLYHGGSLAFAIAVAIVIASLMRAPSGATTLLLRFRPFVMLGLISYGVYLWHWPIIVYATEARVGVSGTALDAVRLGLTLAFALASYFLLERPIRVRWRHRMRWPLTPVGIGLGLLAIVVGTTGATAAPGFFGTGPPVVTSSTTLAPAQAGNPTHVVLVGDSLAASLGPGLDDAMAARGIRFETAATPGCSMLRGVTVAANGHPYPWSRPCAKAIPPALRTVVDTAPRPDLVLWLSTWDAVDRELGGRRVELGSDAGRLVLSREVQRTAALLTARGARLVILTVPQPVAGSVAVLPGLDEAERVRELNRLYQHSGPTADGRVSILDLSSIVCPDGRCSRHVKGIELRPDGAHFGTDGSAYVGRELADAVLTCWRTPATCSEPDPTAVTRPRTQP